ncbi:MAG: saccharopine dehydrogenase C-terminal domain-containing protein, partial [Planctomycetota bacterium]|nr:saccharopine dehydrogenase C-terminal domain-containing protein [Planctomycetota bacterium]
DPGIDHMSAMKTIHQVESRGGRIKGFISYCGGLPAPEANTNPYGYKFSWSPRGVLLAGKNSAQFLWQGKETLIAAKELFEKYITLDVEGLGKFEAYPNRNSLPYIELYGVKSTETMLRGTLRNTGWCPTLKKLIDVGWLEDKPVPGLKSKRFCDLTAALAQGTAWSAPPPASSAKDARDRTAKAVGLAGGSDILTRIEWLGLFSESPLPLETGSPLDIIEKVMLEKLQYAEGERDMIILRHEFHAAYPDGKEEKIVATLIDFGVPGGDSAMARTVGLPAAMGVKMVLEGRLRDTGVVIPLAPHIYRPILAELEKCYAIHFTEKVIPVK